MKPPGSQNLDQNSWPFLNAPESYPVFNSLLVIFACWMLLTKCSSEFECPKFQDHPCWWKSSRVKNLQFSVFFLSWRSRQTPSRGRFSNRPLTKRSLATKRLPSNSPFGEIGRFSCSCGSLWWWVSCCAVVVLLPGLCQCVLSRSVAAWQWMPGMLELRIYVGIVQENVWTWQFKKCPSATEMVKRLSDLEVRDQTVTLIHLGKKNLGNTVSRSNS